MVNQDKSLSFATAFAMLETIVHLLIQWFNKKKKKKKKNSPDVISFKPPLIKILGRGDP